MDELLWMDSTIKLNYQNKDIVLQSNNTFNEDQMFVQIHQHIQRILDNRLDSWNAELEKAPLRLQNNDFQVRSKSEKFPRINNRSSYRGKYEYHMLTKARYTAKRRKYPS